MYICICIHDYIHIYNSIAKLPLSTDVESALKVVIICKIMILSKIFLSQ